MKNLEENIRGIYIRPARAKQYAAAPDWRSSFIMPEKNIFFYTVEGEFALIINEHNYIVQPHQLVLLPAGATVTHWLTHTKHLTLYEVPFCAFIDDEDVFRHFDLASKHHVVDVHDHDEVMRCFQRLSTQPPTENNIPLRISRCAEIINLIYMYIDARILQMTPTTEFTAVIQYMQAHLGEDIALSTLAALTHTSPSHFVEKFRLKVGMAPMKYLSRLRAMRAAGLLAETNLPQADIAKMVGIQNPYYFSRFFEKYIGIAPKEYRSLFQNPPTLNLTQI